jgi:polyisoprenyl-teichoic acid--peptidoglycan teichoic acid transferase
VSRRPLAGPSGLGKIVRCLLALAALAACASPIGGGATLPGQTLSSGTVVAPYQAEATRSPYYPESRPAPPVIPTATPEMEETPQPNELQGRVNILLMGVDERATWSEGPPRTDGLMLISLDATNHTAAVLSIPRDLWVSIPGFGEERVNVAYRVAELDEPGTGPAKACETVSELLGIDVDKYAVVNFRAVVQIIDALGGVDVDVPGEIWDYQYPTEDNQYMTVHFAAGRQTLDGEETLQYIRTRHGSTDFERIRRQQQVIDALRGKALSAGFVTRIPGLLKLARDCINTNVSVSEMMALWQVFGSANRAPVQYAAIDETLSYPWITTAGADVLLPNSGGITQLVADLGLTDGGQAAALAQGLQIRLYADSESDPGFAAAAEALTDAGYVVVQGGVTKNDTGHTVVMDYSGGEQGAKLAKVLGLESAQVLNVPRPANAPAMLAADILLGATTASN